MIKIRKISEFQHILNFKSSEENFNDLFARFLDSNLGKIHQAIPWQELANEFKLQESEKGPDCLFSPKGKLGLMFLKHYACCSDQRLIEQLNANIHYQFFCDILLSPEESIGSFKIVSQIRCELAENLDVYNAQKCLSSNWLPYMQELGHATTDATCYESEVRFPTDIKLLWESVDWSYCQMKMLCKYLKIKLPRTKYLKWKPRYFDYSRKRRKPTKERRVLTRSLLKLLHKINEQLDLIEENYHFEISDRYYDRREIIKNIYTQQLQLFTIGESPKNRIVSISKSYLRPIVRGKETKRVEFGAKVNKIQIYGISFIEHISFDAFNEGTHFKSSVWLA
ncbi:MAG: transposase, partial [Bacteroidales bacterium]|nr:transposase [Bacteroidales bacterium]